MVDLMNKTVTTLNNKLQDLLTRKGLVEPSRGGPTAGERFEYQLEFTDGTIVFIVGDWVGDGIYEPDEVLFSLLVKAIAEYAVWTRSSVFHVLQPIVENFEIPDDRAREAGGS